MLLGAILLVFLAGPLLVAAAVARAFARSDRRDDLWPLYALAATASAAILLYFAFGPDHGGLFAVPLLVCFSASAYATARTLPGLRARRGRNG